jgi:G3E family GTPase
LDPDIVKRILGTRQGTTAEEPSLGAPEPPPEDDHDHDHGHDHGHDFAEQFQSFGGKYGEVFDRGRLESFFARLNQGEYGDVVRAKGVFQTTNEWVRIELASREIRVDPVASAPQSIVSIVGRNIDAREMESGLVGCQT